MSDVLSKVREALGRTQPLSSPPTPPAIPDPITRLVHTEIGLPELFARRAEENKIHVTRTPVDDLLPALIEFLGSHQCRRLVLPQSPFLEKLNIPSALRSAGFEILLWPTISLDAVYDVDAGLTDVYAAVAETGSLVIRAAPSHGRSVSLVPNIHIAIVQPRDLLPDLVDLFEKLPRDGLTSSTTIITGPSKTADIEMNLVMGVHGPRIVQVFLLQ